MNFETLLQGLGEETAQQLQKLIGGRASKLQKNTITTAEGLTGFNLEAPAKLLHSFLAPWRQRISRVTMGGRGTNHKAILSVQRSGSFSAPEGERGTSITMTTEDRAVNYKSQGTGYQVTLEGQRAGLNFDDPIARARSLALLQHLQDEERLMLGGNPTALNSGTGPTPTLAASGSGNTLPAATYHVAIAALTVAGANNGSSIARATAGNVVDFAEVASLSTGVGYTAVGTNVSQAVTTGQQLTITWAAVPNAHAYAVFIGTASGTKRLQGIVTQTEVVVRTPIQLATAPLFTDYAADTSAQTRDYEGVIPRLTANGAVSQVLNGPLSAASGAGIPEIDSVLNRIYDKTDQEPDRMLMAWPERQAIDDAMASNASLSRIQITVPYERFQQGEVPRVTAYKSPRGKMIQLEDTPNLKGGVILFLNDSVPYPNSDIPAAWQIHESAPIVALDYALTKPTDENEIRGHSALADYASALQGILTDIHQF